MPLNRLDHVNVRTSRLQDMITFYTDVLGMTSGPRPPFPFGGAWLYVGENPVVHLVEKAEECAALDPKIEHFAFAATDLNDLKTRLKTAGIDFSIDPVPGIDIVQVNLRDVDGNHIHIDFVSDEANA